MVNNINIMIEEKLKNTDDRNPIKIAYNMNLRYYNDFIELMEIFNNNLSDKEIKDLLTNKLLLGNKYDKPHYLQAVSEVNLLYYVLRNYNNEFKYEPKYNGNKNPECSFKYNDTVINLEVKCPDLTSKIESERMDGIKIFAPERMDQYKEVIFDIIDIVNTNSGCEKLREMKRFDNKLKDYLISASNKFPLSNDENFNILAVSLDIIGDLDEWYGYIFGNKGVFTSESFVLPKNFKNVDAILLSNAMCGHIMYKECTEINVWKLEEGVNLLLLNPKKQSCKKGTFYKKYGIDMFEGLTKKFLLFQQQLDVENTQANIIDYVKYKIIDLQIITVFTEYLKRNSCK